MKPKYHEIKPRKRVIVFCICLCIASFALVIAAGHWNAMIIPVMLSVLIFLFVRNDRILYNDFEVVLFLPPSSRRLYLNWARIVNVEVKYRENRTRVGVYNWYLEITYLLENGKAETLDKLYYNYDGVGDFEAFFNKLKNVDEE